MILQQERQCEAQEVDYLRNTVGSQVILTDQRVNQEEPYRIITEIEVAGKHYVVLDSYFDEDEDIYLFHCQLVEGQHQINPIENEEEWERVTEAYDEWLYFQQHNQNG